MENILCRFTEDLAKKIFGNVRTAENYLIALHRRKPIGHLTFTRSGRLKCSTQEIWRKVVQTWDYAVCKPIVRELFRQTEKYHCGKEACRALRLLIEQWHRLKLGKLAWPFSQGAFDDFVQAINAGKEDGLIKDEKVKQAAVKYRRIKEINTARNDFIETLIFEKNDDIVPTLGHRKGVDFFIKGVSYDQKVAKSPTKEFMRRFGDNWRQQAIQSPELVAEYLYKYQDEGRFGADPRLYIVYLDEDVSAERIEQLIQQADLDKPLHVSFTYKHKSTGEKHYKVFCYVICLYN